MGIVEKEKKRMRGKEEMKGERDETDVRMVLPSMARELR